MSERTPLTQTDLEQHLLEQIAFLEISSAAFDDGFEGEAKRLAVAIRVLLHDTKTSCSLLKQLGKKDVPFLDTSFELSPNTVTSHMGLIALAAGPSKSRYVALLDDVPEAKYVNFENWWNTQVFKDVKGRVFSRKQLVLIAANQDGGAHIDPELNSAYADLSKNNSLGWFAFGVTEQHAGPERTAIRQIAHEVLKTIKPGYGKMPSYDNTFMLTSGVTIELNEPDEGHKRPRQATPRRNEKCPCGSGRKFKNCHGKLK